MSEDTQSRPRPWRWVRTLAAWLAGVVALIALIVVSAALTLTGPLGREWARELMNDREIAGYGALKVGDIDGNLLGEFKLSSLALETEDGAWLRAGDVTVSWDVAALLTRRIEVNAVRIDRLELLRRPQRAPTQGGAGGGSFDWDIDLSTFDIATLSLAEGVAGPQAEYSVTAGFGRVAGDWDGRLQANRLDAPGDMVDARFEYGDAISVDARIEAAPGGPLAQLLRAGELGASARVDARGGVDEGSGEAVLDVGGEGALRFTASWTPQALSVEGRAQPARWPDFERLQTLLGGPADFSLNLPLDGGLSDPRLEEASIQLDAPEAALTVRPQPGRVFAIEGRAGPGLVAEATGGQVAADVLSIENGRVDLSGEDWVFSGDVTAQSLGLPGDFAFARLSGPVTVSGPVQQVRVEADLMTQGARYGVEALTDLLGASPGVNAAVLYDGEAQRLSIERAFLQAPLGRVSASGVVDLGAERFDLDIASADFDIARLTDSMSGRGAVEASVQGGFDGAVAFDASASGFQPAGGLADQLSGPVSAEAEGRRTAEGALTFDRLQVQSPDLVVDAAGRQDGEVFNFSGEAVYSGQSPVAGVGVAGTVQAAFEARYGPGGLEARIDASAGQVSGGPLEINEARVRLAVSGALDALSGEARLTGESPRGPVDLAANFARDGDRVSVTGLSGRAGGLNVEGSAEAGPGALQADLDIAPEEGFGALSLQARLQDGALDVRASAEDLVAGDLNYFDVFEFTLTGPPEDAAFTLVADGAYGAPFNVTSQGRLQLAGGPFQATASLNGEYGGIPIRSRAPLSVTAGDPLTASADLSVGDGFVTLAYQGGEAERVTASLRDVPAAILALRRAREPLQGALSGDLNLSRSNGVWTGQAMVQGDGLRPADVDQDRALDGAVTLDLNSERLEVGVRADGPEFMALADASVVTGPVSGPGDVTDPANAVSADIQVSGRIGAFAAFHVASGQRLSGDLQLDAQVSGSVGAPDLVGDAALTGARFSDSRAGLSLEELVVRASFTQSRAEITELSAVDGQGGELSGEGAVEFAGGLSARANAVFESFQIIDRRDVSAVASGDVAFNLSGGEGSITGAATIESAEVSPPDSGRPSIPDIQETQINLPGGVRTPDAAPGDGGPVISLDYTIDAPRRIFVRGSNFDTEWGMNLQVTGTTNNPEVYGVARVARGRADLLGRVFDIESGEVRLTGDPREARLRLTAVREERDITARIIVEGPVTSPTIDLRSSPSLPPDEVASRILFGEGAANLSGLQAAQLAASLASLSGGGGFDPLGALRQASGLDQLGVRQDAGGGTVVSGGRYLTDTVYLELESAGSSAAPSTNIEWELTRRFTLLSRLSSDGQAGVALSWRTEYDDDPFGEGGLFDFDRLNIFGFRRGEQVEAEPGDAVLEDAAEGEIIPQAPRDEDGAVTTLQRSGGD
ncbi:translocation/assembly module TamB domain-containing protein [Maricaulaceae bacterium MS644]